MRIKDGVRFHTGEMAMMHASMVVLEVCRELSIPFVLTGGKEDPDSETGERRPNTLHHRGWAHDYRANHVSRELAERMAYGTRESLGDGFDVVLHEGESGELHMHVEYDCKD